MLPIWDRQLDPIGCLVNPDVASVTFKHRLISWDCPLLPMWFNNQTNAFEPIFVHIECLNPCPFFKTTARRRIAGRCLTGLGGPMYVTKSGTVLQSAS